MKTEKINREREKGIFSSVTLDPDFPVSKPSFASQGLTEEGLPHLHDALEIGLCDHGHGMFQVGAKIIACQPGDAIVINQHEFHSFKALPDEKISWRFLNINVFRLLAAIPETDEWCRRSEFLCGPNFPNRFRPEESPEIVHMIRRIFEEMQNRREGYRIMVRLLVNELLVLLGRTFVRQTEESSEETVQPEALTRIAPALRYMAIHSTESFPVSRLARLCCVSEVHFRRLFHTAVGCTPVDYLLNFRLGNAAAMLRGSTQSIDEIAGKCGFRSLSYFEHQFKSRFALSPRQYRKSK